MTTDWLDELDGTRVRVEVPASSANLGAGYDCLGLALALTDRIELEVRAGRHGGIELDVDGEGKDELPENGENRFVLGLEAALRAARGDLPATVGWRIKMHNAIPLARGLGSSAAATVAGIVAGNALAGEALTTGEQLRLATDIEGHPDNAAAALLGGFVVSAVGHEGTVEAIRFVAPRDLRAVLFIPDLRLATGRMRGALPEMVPLADAVANVAHASLLMLGLSRGDWDLVGRGLVDRLHQPYRAHLFPRSMELVKRAPALGALGATISGAGPTVLVWCHYEQTGAVLDALRREAADWAQVLRAPFEPHGADVREL